MKYNKITGFSMFGLMQIGCIMLSTSSIISLLSGRYWLFDLFTHFRFQYLIGSAFLVVGFLYLKNKTYLLISSLILLINLSYIIPIYLDRAAPVSGDFMERIKFFHANVLTSNTEHEQLIKQISDENPDVILLQEVNDRWVADLIGLNQNYPYRIDATRADNFGQVLFSKIHISEHQIHLWSDLDIPNIVARFKKNDTAFTVIASHPPPPVNRYYHQARTSIFEEISQLSQSAEKPLVVIGDLNTTIWSNAYRILENDTNFRNASTGYGYIPTWPTNLLPLMIPIDHCLVSDDIQVIGLKTGGSFGSDHLPLIIELGI